MGECYVLGEYVELCVLFNLKWTRILLLHEIFRKQLYRLRTHYYSIESFKLVMVAHSCTAKHAAILAQKDQWQRHANSSIIVIL